MSDVEEVVVKEEISGSPIDKEGSPDTRDSILEEVAVSNASPKDDEMPEMEGELDFEEEIQESSSPQGPAKNEKEEFEEEIVSEEEGECSPERQEKSAAETGKDEGEVSDDGELEEGELKEEVSGSKDPTLPICKFFMRGRCSWGSLCRFLHLADTSKGLYSMFEKPTMYQKQQAPPPMPPPPMMPPMPMMPMIPPEFMPMPPMMPIPPPMESSETPWQRGLRQAKEMIKQAQKRKREEPDFEDKKYNLTLKDTEFDKENDNRESKRKRRDERQSFEQDVEEEEVFEEETWEPKERWRGNYNSHRNNDDWHENRGRDWNRGTGRGRSYERGRFQRHNRGRGRFRESPPHTRSRGDEYFDPWRRSKSPGENRNSRLRSDSYSSISSNSYSDRTSRSSRYSYMSSDSKRHSRSASYSGSRSSRSVSRSRSTRSRTYSRHSRSISVESVSSISSKSRSRSRDDAQKRTPPSNIQPKQEPRSKDAAPPPPKESFRSLHHLLPVHEQTQRQPIKLTLLNKETSAKQNIAKRMIDINKPPRTKEEPTKKAQPPKPPSPKTVEPPKPPKKATDSRRDKLLQQLKAVEDAIARKRAKV